MKKELFDERNSLLFWFPKVLKLNVPVPITSWIKFPNELGRRLLGAEEEELDKACKEFEPYLKKMKVVAKGIGYPVFIRTDMASHKHGWRKSSFVRNESKLFSHIRETLEHNEMVGLIGLNYEAIVIREFLELDWRFRAFHGEMPIARERRYFVKGGKVLCHHPYWIKETVSRVHRREGTTTFIGYLPHRLPNKWEEMLEELNNETQPEVTLLTNYAKRISKVVKGYWSVDFACTRDGEWYLIDMALGKASWHPECKHKLRKDKREGKKEVLV